MHQDLRSPPFKSETERLLYADELSYQRDLFIQGLDILFHQFLARVNLGQADAHV
jgi:hypothetical protein